ncbi:hypothetical protein [Cupriavidus basilensis]|nr:hypothetical protein [Cupriavidus basilensis]
MSLNEDELPLLAQTVGFPLDVVTQQRSSQPEQRRLRRTACNHD